MFELLIRNGDMVRAEGMIRVDIAVREAYRGLAGLHCGVLRLGEALQALLNN